MKRSLSFILAILLLCTAPSSGIVSYGDTYSASSLGEIESLVEEMVSQRADSFAIHYKGPENLINVNVLDAITTSDGTQKSNFLRGVYGLESIWYQVRYSKGTDMVYSFTADYNFSRSQLSKLDEDLQFWTDNNISMDMYEPVKAAIISRALSARLQYLRESDRNNGYQAYYGLQTACLGYTELTWRMLAKAGIDAKVIIGYTPQDLSDTEYLSKTFTSAEMQSLTQQDKNTQMQTLHAWNLARIDGRWYQLDNTWLDGNQQGTQTQDKIYPQYFLGSDGDFGRDHLWVHNEYPTASSNWWDEGSGELRSFLKAYMNTRIFDYPRVSSLAQLDAFAENSYQSGRGSQVFRITQGVQSYAEFPPLDKAYDLSRRDYTEYRITPKYPNDSYLLTLDFVGRDPLAKEALPGVLPAVKVSRGDLINPVQLLTNPERSNTAPVKWISLSPTMLKTSGESFTAMKEGRAYIGVYTRDEAVIIPVTIASPQLRVSLNGTVINLSPNPLILNGRTLVPLRGIFEAMGASVSYDPEKRTITGERGGKSLFLTLDSKNAIINGQSVLLDVPPQIIGDRTFVPARMIAESLGASVQWDPVGNQVIITDN